MNSADKDSRSPVDLADFLRGGGEMAERIHARDWSESLGEIASWPPSLRTTVGLLLHTTVPMVLLWGEDGVMIYNDAYSVFAGGRHPKLLGGKVREGWPEVAAFNDNVMRVVLGGGTLAYKDQRLTLFRSGQPEPVWMNLDYSPVIDESGRPGGVIAIVVETTARVLADRRAAAEQKRQRQLFSQMPGFVCVGMNGRQVADAARVMRPAMKVLFVTGYAENAVLGSGHLDPGMQVITKPFGMAALGRKVREIIAR